MASPVLLNILFSLPCLSSLPFVSGLVMLRMDLFLVRYVMLFCYPFLSTFVSFVVLFLSISDSISLQAGFSILHYVTASFFSLSFVSVQVSAQRSLVVGESMSLLVVSCRKMLYSPNFFFACLPRYWY